MTSRFYCPSFGLDLRRLFSRHHKTLWICAIVAACFHFAVAHLVTFGEEQQVAKPLTTQFIKRQPRLTKPLELKKRPQPKRRSIQREMVTVQARVDRQQIVSGIQPVAVVQSLAKPQTAIGRIASFAAVDMDPEVVAQVVESTKQAKEMVNMSLEMMDIEALDTGEYHAMVIQDPNDKRNIRGFFHLAVAYSVNMREIDWHNADARIRFGLVRLVDTINRYTEIKADLRGTVQIDSQELLQTPWVWVYPVFTFVLSVSEATNLGTYMLTGGFLLADSGELGGQRDVAARQMIKDALAAQGKTFGSDWNFVRLPNSHPVYHCFFEFPEGPPTAGDWQYHADGLDGIFFDRRLVSIMSNKNFENAWGDQGPDGAGTRMGHNYGHLDPTRALQFGVNLVIFALTQEGSITNRVMDAVR